jgi:hypothetical protein
VLLRIKFKTAQMLRWGGLLANMLASMKAEVPMVVEHPDDDVQTAFWPWLPCASA